MANDWIPGDLLKVTKEHCFAKGNPEGIWPDVFCKTSNSNQNEELIHTDEIPCGTVVMALDLKPRAGHRAYVRVLYEDGVWVANSNLVVREQCTTDTQEKCLL